MAAALEMDQQSAVNRGRKWLVNFNVFRKKKNSFNLTTIENLFLSAISSSLELIFIFPGYTQKKYASYSVVPGFTW